jgi:acetyltransferase-like isoleucine patch superfamily enzyme
MTRWLLQKARGLAWRMSYGGGARWRSRWRLRWQVFRNPRANIVFGRNVDAGPGFKIQAPWGGTLIVGDNVEFRRNVLFELWGPDTRVTIGDECHFTYDVIFQIGTTVVIGDRVQMGQNTIVVDGNHRYRDLTQKFLDQGFDFRPITIENDAVVLSKVTIVNDIGERAIVGANAVVTKPVPPFTVVGGVPARVIEYFGPPGLEPEGWEPAAEARART